MCHGKIKGSKTVKYQTDKPHHVNAIPYKRGEKHKADYREAKY